jgi:Na+-transporting methylmalonyl-CoA/oxaloacetate decarboxylase gamma subunit
VNRNLAGLALLLILLGIGVGLYLLAFIGLLILIPALLAPSKVPSRPVPIPAKQETRRIAPPLLQKQPESNIKVSQQQGAMVVPVQSSTSTPTYSPALFPTSIFPSMSQVTKYGQPPTPTNPPKSEERDELLEIGAILAILKIAFG